MRPLTLALCVPLALAGCLFVGDVNERPSVSVQALIQSTTLGMPIELSVKVTDDQDQTRLAMVVRDQAGNVVDDPCVAAVASSSATGNALTTYLVTIWRAGTYTVEATPTDRYGATGSSATVQLEVSDAPPSFDQQTNQLRPGTPATACSALYPTGRPIPITLQQGVDDPEQHWTPPPPSCTDLQPPPLVYTWHILSRPTGSAATLGRAVGGSCPDAPFDGATDLVDPADIVCLYPDPNLPTGTPSMYTVALDVSDGTTTKRSDSLAVPVIGDAPACLDGTYPAAGSYVVDRMQPMVFQAVGVDDVSAASTLTFTWSLERASENSYTALGAPLSAGDGGDRLVFDPVALGLAVGDQLHLRVDIDDPAEPGPNCDPVDDLCEAASCAAGSSTTCPRRATWALEIR
jgi:hypothetical protein